MISLLKDARSELARRLRLQNPCDIGISSIVLHELYFGAFKSQRQQANLTVVDGLHFQVLDFTLEDAREAGRLRAELGAAGCPIGPLDVLIAGQAVARNLILVTHNASEFGRVPGLRWEDWETAS